MLEKGAKEKKSGLASISIKARACARDARDVSYTGLYTYMAPGLMFTLRRQTLGVRERPGAWRKQVRARAAIGSLSATNAPRMRSLLSARRPGSGAARTQALAPEHQVPEERARYALTFFGTPLPPASAIGVLP